MARLKPTYQLLPFSAFRASKCSIYFDLTAMRVVHFSVLDLDCGVADRLTPERRSWNMSRIKGRNTRPEKLVRSLLHSMGYRFRLHATKLPGRPDVLLPKYNTAIFVHGCYWHRHQGCTYAYTPKTRVDFWQRKFDENVGRDKQTLKSLRKLGWRVLVVWECQITNHKMLATRLSRFLEKSSPQMATVLRNRENSSGSIRTTSSVSRL
jgi:DNA mismatch endonuclease (patch repair protein)